MLLKTIVTYDPHHQAYEVLRRGKWFGRLPPSQAKALFDAGRMETYEAGESLYREAYDAPGLFGLLDGAVHFDRFDMSGQRILLNIAGPGYWFGDIATAAERHTIVNATAFGPVRAWRVPPTSANQVMDHSPELLAAFHELVAARFDGVIELVCALRRSSVLARVAGRLALLDRICKEGDSDVDISVIHMTQNDLADMIGHVRQTVNTTVKRLERDKLIRIGNRQITILDPTRLEQYAMS